MTHPKPTTRTRTARPAPRAGSNLLTLVVLPTTFPAALLAWVLGSTATVAVVGFALLLAMALLLAAAAFAAVGSVVVPSTLLLLFTFGFTASVAILTAQRVATWFHSRSREPTSSPARQPARPRTTPSPTSLVLEHDYPDSTALLA